MHLMDKVVVSVLLSRACTELKPVFFFMYANFERSVYSLHKKLHTQVKS